MAFLESSSTLRCAAVCARRRLSLDAFSCNAAHCPSAAQAAARLGSSGSRAARNCSPWRAMSCVSERPNQQIRCRATLSAIIARTSISSVGGMLRAFTSISIEGNVRAATDSSGGLVTGSAVAGFLPVDLLRGFVFPDPERTMGVATVAFAVACPVPCVRFRPATSHLKSTPSKQLPSSPYYTPHLLLIAPNFRYTTRHTWDERRCSGRFLLLRGSRHGG